MIPKHLFDEADRFKHAPKDTPGSVLYQLLQFFREREKVHISAAIPNHYDCASSTALKQTEFLLSTALDSGTEYLCTIEDLQRRVSELESRLKCPSP